MNIGDPFHFAVRQALFAVLGSIVLLAVSMLSPRGIRRSAFFIYAIAIAIMVALPLLGHHAKGAHPLAGVRRLFPCSRRSS